MRTHFISVIVFGAVEAIVNLRSVGCGVNITLSVIFSTAPKPRQMLAPNLQYHPHQLTSSWRCLRNIRRKLFDIFLCHFASRHLRLKKKTAKIGEFQEYVVLSNREANKSKKKQNRALFKMPISDFSFFPILHKLCTHDSGLDKYIPMFVSRTPEKRNSSLKRNGIHAEYESIIV